jgi:hypothetical protein
MLAKRTVFNLGAKFVAFCKSPLPPPPHTHKSNPLNPQGILKWKGCFNNRNGGAERTLFSLLSSFSSFPQVSVEDRTI